jgi:hypothetical protein
VKGQGGPFEGPSFFLSNTWSVESRIFIATNQQLSRLRTQDLPVVAKAICGYSRKLVNVEQCIKRQVPFVRLFASNLEVCVLYSDWKKILPYIASGWVTPGVVAPQWPPDRQHNAQAFSLGLADLETWDKAFYTKVLSILQILFTESYPTSNL